MFTDPKNQSKFKSTSDHQTNGVAYVWFCAKCFSMEEFQTRKYIQFQIYFVGCMRRIVRSVIMTILCFCHLPLQFIRHIQTHKIDEINVDIIVCFQFQLKISLCVCICISPEAFIIYRKRFCSFNTLTMYFGCLTQWCGNIFFVFILWNIIRK